MNVLNLKFYCHQYIKHFKNPHIKQRACYTKPYVQDSTSIALSTFKRKTEQLQMLLEAYHMYPSLQVNFNTNTVFMHYVFYPLPVSAYVLSFNAAPPYNVGFQMVSIQLIHNQHCNDKR